MVDTARNRVIFAFVVLVFTMVGGIDKAFSALSVSPTSVNLKVGESESVDITGGTGFFQVSSSDENVAKIFVSGTPADKGTIQGISVGTATITIEDETGELVTVSVQVSDISLSKTSVTLVPKGVETVTILTGSGYYNVASSDDKVATASIANDIITITGVSPGTAEITVSDTSAGTIIISVVVGSGFTVDPSSATIAIGETVESVISEKTGTYTADSSDPKVAEVQVSGNKVSITGISNGDATITVENSLGISVSIDVTVELSWFFKLDLGLSETFDFPLAAGSGFFNVTVSDKDVVSVALDIDTATITGKGPGNAEVVITDDQSNKAVIEVTVPLSAPELNLNINNNQVTLTWDKVLNADYYLLYYAPADETGTYDMGNIGVLNVGNIGNQIFDLPSGYHYFVALQAINMTYPDVSSQLSNIEEVKIP